MMDADWMINRYLGQMGVRRHERPEKTIFVGGRKISVAQAGTAVVTLPDGTRCGVWTSDGGHTTQVEENDRLHAVVRPRTIRRKVRIM